MVLELLISEKDASFFVMGGAVLFEQVVDLSFFGMDASIFEKDGEVPVMV